MVRQFWHSRQDPGDSYSQDWILKGNSDIRETISEHKGAHPPGWYQQGKCQFTDISLVLSQLISLHYVTY